MRGEVTGSTRCFGRGDSAPRVNSDAYHHTARPFAVGDGFSPILKRITCQSCHTGLAGENALAGIATGCTLLASTLSLTAAEGVFHPVVGGAAGRSLLLAGVLGLGFLSLGFFILGFGLFYLLFILLNGALVLGLGFLGLFFHLVGRLGLLRHQGWSLLVGFASIFQIIGIDVGFIALFG